MSPSSDPLLRFAPEVPEPAQERFREAFTGFLERTDGGMAFAVHREGRPLIELRGGVTAPDGGQPWSESTLTCLFSGTKGLTAAVAGLAVDDGLLDPQAPVAELWPEFAAAGKGQARVHHVMSHTLGLLYVDPADESLEQKLDNRLMADRLSAQPTLWEPGRKVAYHALTYGYLMTELLRRATGRSVGELIRTRLAEPLGLDLWLGLPEEHEPRVSTVFREPGYRIATFLEEDAERRAIVDRMYGSSLTGAELPSNLRIMHAGQMSAGGALGTASSMSRLYSLLAEGPVLSRPTLELMTREWAAGPDAVNDRPLRYGLGFELDDPIGTYGPAQPAFGHSGAGGGLHGAWPERGLGFSFLPNELVSEDTDQRVKTLLRILDQTGL